MTVPRAATAAEVLGRVRQLAATHPDRTVWVGIDGFGASGKTTLAALLAAEVDRVVVVHVDDFWGPSIAEWDWVRFRQQVVAPLVAGRPSRYQLWDWDLDAGGRWCDLAPGRVVVVEGVSATRREVVLRWDLTVWVEAPRAVRLARALQRDGAAMLPRWLDDWMPSEQRYADRERPRDRVDLVVDGAAAAPATRTDHG